VASYTLSARLDAESHIVRASGTLRLVNTATRPLDELWFHLYLNAFKNEKTLFLRSPFGAGRSGERARHWGYIDVERLAAREFSGVDLWKQAAPHSPDDRADQTDIRVPLPQPLAPGQTLTLDVSFVAKLPEIVERTGYSGAFHFVAQWFPKLARLMPDGSFAHFPFHAQSEFDADYGTYDVTLDVPEHMVVGATGVRVAERRSNGRLVVRHRADSVHDFAWTAWEGFRERRERIDGVDVRVLHPPAHERNAEVTLQTLRFALPHFSRRYGRYAYPVLTVVHPPEHARNAGGMEYPTLITTGGPWYVGHAGVRAVEAVTVHELGHQWFYGLIATDERRFPFLDEGLNSYAESVALGELFGVASLFDGLGIELSVDALRRALSAERGREVAAGLPAADYPSFRALGALVYSRTATVLRTFAAVYGEARMARALFHYAREQRFRHPEPKDFLDVIRRELGSEAATLLKRALFERASVDYAVREFSSVRAAAPAGVFDTKSGRETVNPETNEDDDRWIGRAVVVRRGELELPVDIELVTADGRRTRRHWDGRGAWTAIDYTGTSRLISVWVDPQCKIALDDNLLDNAKSLEPAGAPRTLERALYLSELLLALFGP
jgi:hypothetical protein